MSSSAYLYTDVQALVTVCKGYVSAELLGCEIFPTEIVHPGTLEKVSLNKVRLSNHPYTVGWLLDSESTICMSCGEEFGYFTSKHHCRLCGLVFCDECSQYKHEVKGLEEFEGSRVCSNCFIKASNQDNNAGQQAEGQNLDFHSSPKTNPLKKDHDFYDGDDVSGGTSDPQQDSDAASARMKSAFRDKSLARPTKKGTDDTGND